MNRNEFENALMSTIVEYISVYADRRIQYVSEKAGH